MNWNLLPRQRGAAAAPSTDASAGSPPVYRVSPMRAAFGPVLSVMNPAPPVSRPQRWAQASAITLSGLLMLTVPFAALTWSTGELGGMKSPTAGQHVPGVPVDTVVGTVPTALPLASPNAAPASVQD